MAQRNRTEQTLVFYEFQVHEESVVSSVRVLQGKSDFISCVETKRMRKELEVKRKGKFKSVGREGQAVWGIE